MRHERALRRMGSLVVALCRVVLDYEDAGEDARELAEEVLRELDGGDAS